MSLQWYRILIYVGGYKLKTTEFVQAIRKMAFGIDKVTCFGEGIIYRIWVPKNQYDSVKVAMIWQDKKQKIIEPE